jgi:hypothetical protein
MSHWKGDAICPGEIIRAFGLDVVLKSPRRLWLYWCRGQNLTDGILPATRTRRQPETLAKPVYVTPGQLYRLGVGQ